MIKTLYSEGRYIPMVVCDACKKPITDADMGLALNKSRDLIEGQFVETFHAHKGDCDRQLEKRIDPKFGSGSTELARHLFQVTHNAGVTRAKLEEIDDRDDILGRLP